MKPWDPTAPLVPGTTVVEASAGTGKTYQITNLVVRLVAEVGLPVREILIVTFTRAATAELEDRIRRRLDLAAAALDDGDDRGDPVLASLIARQPGDLWAQRLRGAQEGFDEAVIATIHGFCQRMLQEHALSAGEDPDLTLLADLEPLLDELVDDALSSARYDLDDAGWAHLVERCGFRRDGLRALAMQVASDPELTILPTEGDGATLDAWEAEVADAARWWADEGATALEEAFDYAYITDAITPLPGKRTQRTYTGPRARALGDEVIAWAQGTDDPRPPPALARYFSEAALRPYCPGAPFRHPALDRIRRLLGFGARVAASERARFARGLRDRLAERCAERRVQTYQDLLHKLARRLDPARGGEGGAAVAAAIGGRFRAALIDEFQDTDAHQWGIFQRSFADDAHHLYLIGDPKQAIYGFRGANIHVYRAAVRTAGAVHTLARSYRSDGRLVAALNHLLGAPDGASVFGDPSIRYVQVDAHHRDDRLRWPISEGEDPDGAAPLQIRFFDDRVDPRGSALSLGGRFSASDRDEPEEAEAGGLTRSRARELLPLRVAADVADLLAREARIEDRPLGAGDVAVLVRTHAEAAAVHAALLASGIPAVRSGADSVLRSDEAGALLQWLEAVASPSRSGPARTAATSHLFPFTADDLLRLDAAEPGAVAAWDGWQSSLRRWQETAGHGGFLAAWRCALDEHEVIERLLGWPDGERRVTDLRHVTELVHTASLRQRLGLRGLARWLEGQRVGRPDPDDDTELRLERDDDAVRVLTIHKSKGLQFPVVFVPFLWDGRAPLGASDPLVLADPDDPTQRLLDLYVDAEQSPRREHLALAERALREEDLRLLYVALTRAEHRLVVYTGAFGKPGAAARAPLAVALHGREATGGDRLDLAARRVQTASPGDLLDDVAQIAASSAVEGRPTVAVTVCEPPPPPRGRPSDASPPELAARPFTRTVDRVWRRLSYTGLVRSAAASARDPLSEAARDHDQAVDDHAPTHAPDPPPPLPDPAPLPLATLPGGAQMGTFLHEVMEHLDFQDAAREGGEDALAAVVDDRLASSALPPGSLRPLLLDALPRILQTPLGGPLGDLTLADLPRGRRLDELAFDLPVGNGVPIPSSALSEAFLPATEPGSGSRIGADYVRTLQAMDFGLLAGFLTGSIDLVFATPVDGAPKRWFVVDYKSNRLDLRQTGEVTLPSFCQRWLTWEMAHHHYILQYHLYTLALHRYLRHRVAGYDYDTHMGGAYYLFVRGMIGPQTPSEGDHRYGVFYDRPSRGVIEALDRLFAGESGGGER